MTTRLRARRGFAYPATSEGLRLVREAGGLSKMTPAERARVRYRTVQPGGWCDDMPEESVALYVARGEVELVPMIEEAPVDGR